MTKLLDRGFSMKEMFSAKAVRAKAHFWPFMYMIALIMALYLCSVFIPPGWITWGFSTIALFIIGITALARLDDIGPDHNSKRWNVRRAGLVMVVAAAFGIAASDPVRAMFSGVPVSDFPSWKEVLLRWGVALTWITTPHMPPWWRYISGRYRTERDAVKAAAATEISGLYPTGEYPVYVSPEMTEAVIKMEEVAASAPPKMRPHEDEIERRKGGDRRETDL